ncbi:MAG: 30S ribosomal protein S20 [Deltaproteobacteria bacterium]|nr:30S ribosomal protein S20 [Deltaproteobacteria bacterium]
MANHPQAKKRSRQATKRTARNRHIRSTMRTFVKRLRTAIDEGNAAEAQELLTVARKQLDKAAGKGVLKRETASRTVSRLTIAVNKIVGKPAKA